MKKFLFTLAALFMAGTALADSGFYFGEFDESTLGTTNESTLTLTQDDLAGEYEMYLKAYWSARISGTECVVTYPEGMTVVFAEPGADATVNTLNGRGRPATETAAFSGMVEPFDHFVTLFSTAGYYKDEEGNIVTYGVNKWEAGYYEEMGIFYVEFDEGFQGGDIVVLTNVSSGKDPRGGTVRENGENAHGFTFTCHVVVEGAVPPTPEKTETPTINVVDNPEGEYLMISAEGNGEVKLYIDGMEVSNPFQYNYQAEEHDIVITATAQEEDKEISDTAEETYTVPAKAPVYTDKPVITVVDDPETQTVTVTATGNGHICLYWDDMLQAEGEGVAEWVIPYGDDPEGEEYGISATAQEPGKEISEYALETVYVPGKVVIITKTDMPEINVEVNEEEEYVMISATGNGEVKLYVDGMEVSNPFMYRFQDEPNDIVITATAKEEGKEISDEARLEYTVPAKSVYETPAPVVAAELTDEALVITATGEGNVTIYVQYINNETGDMTTEQFDGEGTAVANIARGTETFYINYWAVAQADEEAIPGISETEYYVEVPAIVVVPEVTEKPVITVVDDPEAQTVTVTATGNGHICLYWDDMLQAEGEGVAEWVIPYGEDPEGEEYGVSATAQEPNKEVSEYALETVYVPGKPAQPYETPAPVVETELTDEALVITATGEGHVILFVQYIDNETGAMTTEQYEGEGTVTVNVPRAEENTYINYWASAQADDEAVPGVTEAEYYVEVPAAEEVGPVDPHATGWWIVLTQANGEEVWYELHEGTDGSFVTTVTLNYGDYGTFYWDPEKSAEENNVNRPNVPYYFVVDGQVWGAPEDGKATLMGEAANTMSNPLYENANHYTVPVGYSYVLGIYVDPTEEDQLGDGTWYYVYCAQGPQTDVDELNAAKTVAGVRYFNLAGQEMQEANGMTIVVTTYTDGTTSAVKVMK